MASQAASIIRDYARSLNVLERAIRTSDPARWDDQSPCTQWSARQVAGHAMAFLTNVVALAGEGPAPDFTQPADTAAFAGEDPNLRWTTTRHLVESELLTRPDRLEAVRMAPLGVEMPILTLLTFQGLDPVVHAWDIAMTTGGIADIPDDLAEAYKVRFEPVIDGLRASGRLGPETEPTDDPVGRLLAFCGRKLPVAAR